MVFCISSCNQVQDYFDPPKKKPPLIPQVTIVNQDPNQTDSQTDLKQVQADLLFCQKKLKQNETFSVVENDKNNTIQLDFYDDAELEEDRFLQSVLLFSDLIYQDARCPYEKVFIKGTGAGAHYFQAIVLRSDYLLYREGQISLAELGRRFDVKSVETLASIKEKLRKARQNENHGLAVQLVEAWLEKEPDHQKAKFIQGNIALDKNDFTQAVQVYEDFLFVEKNNAEAWMNLAFAKRKLGLFEEAIAIFQKLLQEEKDFEKLRFSKDDVLLNLAQACLDNNQLKKSSEALQKIENKQTVVYQILLAKIKRQEKKFQEAEDILQKLLKNEKDELVLFDLILVQLDQKKGKEARENFQELELNFPDLARELQFLTVFQEDKYEL